MLDKLRPRRKLCAALLAWSALAPSTFVQPSYAVETGVSVEERIEDSFLKKVFDGATYVMWVLGGANPCLKPKKKVCPKAAPAPRPSIPKPTEIEMQPLTGGRRGGSNGSDTRPSNGTTGSNIGNNTTGGSQSSGDAGGGGDGDKKDPRPPIPACFKNGLCIGALGVGGAAAGAIIWNSGDRCRWRKQPETTATKESEWKAYANAQIDELIIRDYGSTEEHPLAPNLTRWRRIAGGLPLTLLSKKPVDGAYAVAIGIKFIKGKEAAQLVRAMIDNDGRLKPKEGGCSLDFIEPNYPVYSAQSRFSPSSLPSYPPRYAIKPEEKNLAIIYNDPSFSEEWHLKPWNYKGNGYGADFIGAWEQLERWHQFAISAKGESAYVGFSTKPITIAVVEPGYALDANHASTPQRFLRPPQFPEVKMSEGFATEKAGNISTKVEDWSCITTTAAAVSSADDANPDSCGASHAGQVTSVIAAVVNNKIGVAGALGYGVSDWDKWFSVIGVSINSGWFDAYSALRALRLSATPPKVVNMSFGSPAGTCNTLLTEEIARDIAKGMILVAAAGNALEEKLGPDGKSTGEKYTQHDAAAPAKCDGVISVTAHNAKGEAMDSEHKWMFGKAGSINAPGDQIPTYIPGLRRLKGAYTDWGFGSGTSVAAPQVSAAVAMMAAILPDINSTEANQLLQEYGHRTQSSNDHYLDAGASLRVLRLFREQSVEKKIPLDRAEVKETDISSDMLKGSALKTKP